MTIHGRWLAPTLVVLGVHGMIRASSHTDPLGYVIGAIALAIGVLLAIDTDRAERP
jgi:hypothetical protein